MQAVNRRMGSSSYAFVLDLIARRTSRRSVPAARRVVGAPKVDATEVPAARAGCRSVRQTAASWGKKAAFAHRPHDRIALFGGGSRRENRDLWDATPGSSRSRACYPISLTHSDRRRWPVSGPYHLRGEIRAPQKAAAGAPQAVAAMTQIDPNHHSTRANLHRVVLPVK